MAAKLTPEQAGKTLLTAEPTLKKVLGTSECIRHTRIAVDVCHHWGVRARALPVAVEINAPGAPMPLRLGFEGDPVEDSRGAETIWDGHLVAMLDGRLMLDLTIDSMARPEFGLKPEPFVVRVPVKFDRFEVDVDGGRAIYIATPDRTDYRTTPSWSPGLSDKESADMAAIFENLQAAKDGRPLPW